MPTIKQKKTSFFQTLLFWGIPVVLLVAGYFVTRLVNLTALPIFTDEAIYIRWSQIGSRDPEWRLISLTDGKQPLFTWILMVLLRLLPAFDPLFTGRLVSVLSGFGSIVGIWFLTYILFHNPRQSFIASALYLISPFFLMYDRLALYDSLTTTCAIWAMIFSILLVKTLRLDIAMILGFILGFGMLNKTSGFLLLYMIPITLLLFDFKSRGIIKRLCIWIVLVIISAVISQGMYTILRLSPIFHTIGQKDTVFVYSISEWMTQPFRFLEGNLKGLFDWLVSYITRPMFVMSLIPLVIFWQKFKEKLLLFAYFIFPFTALALFGKVLYPRYILFMSVPLLVLATIILDYLIYQCTKKQHGNFLRIISLLLFIGIVFPSVKVSYFIITDILHAPIHPADRGQLIDDWPSGWGVRETVTFLTEAAKNGKLVVYTDGTFGLFMHSLEIYLVDNPNVKIKGIWPMPKTYTQEMSADIEEGSVYLVMNKTEELLAGNLKLIAKFQKGLNRERSLRLYQLLPDPKERL